ncbi:unnamed protein product [Rotaria sordida]|uniref:Uncharacterized protein n=1 Tax=Rotaria sordida TaxID=392033 RepID=A0A815AX95_9BILA|nr:unnamed protein product [Rotaria sordida]CAF3998871.1 unnamed protein product [Rotaria sordida]
MHFIKKTEKKFKSLLKIRRSNHQELLENLRVEEASQFYFACRNGDIDTVKQILPTIPYDQLNQLEPNGSTALHVATYFGHVDIVRLLLHEYGCQRNLQDRHGFTAYEKVQTDEMRQLYDRPSNENRFNDDSMDIKQIFEILSSSINKIIIGDRDDDDDVAKPNKRYLIDYETNEEVKNQLDNINSAKVFFQSRIGRYIMGQRMKLKLGKKDDYDEEEYAYVTSEKFRQESLQKVLDEYVTSNHPDYQYWKNKDSVLSLLTFASTSINRNVAEQFSAKSSSSSDKISVLLIFHFSQRCDTAINLSKIPVYQLPCISNFENEEEVLISPRTFFKVTDIEIDRPYEQYMIYLENVCGEQQTMLKALKFFLSVGLKKKTNEDMLGT